MAILGEPYPCKIDLIRTGLTGSTKNILMKELKRQCAFYMYLLSHIQKRQFNWIS